MSSLSGYIPSSVSKSDIATFALASASYATNWTSGNLSNSLIGGFRGFALISLVDKILRNFILDSTTKKDKAPLFGGLINAVIEEFIYAGVLQSSNAWLSIARLPATLAFATTAARTLTVTGRVDPSAKGLSKDVLCGLVWTVARETLLQTLPNTYSAPLLIAADSTMFALAELCPKPGQPEISLNRATVYKMISSLFFRATANINAANNGMGASLIQHALFNAKESLS